MNYFSLYDLKEVFNPKLASFLYQKCNHHLTPARLRRNGRAATTSHFKLNELVTLLKPNDSKYVSPRTQQEALVKLAEYKSLETEWKKHIANLEINKEK